LNPAHDGVKLSQVFDELIASDQANRLHQHMQEAAFKDRELQRLREALARAQKDCSWAQQKQVAAEDALSKAANSASAQQTELKALQATHEQQRQQLHSLTSAKATADHAAAMAESKLASLEANLSRKSSELEQVQSQYKRLLADQQTELERLRQQLQQQSSELSKLQTSSAQKEHSLLQQLQGFNGTLQDTRAHHAADKATAEQLQAQLLQHQRDLQDARGGRQQAEATAKQLEGLLADSETERRTLRAKYINLGKLHHAEQ
jgi:chromosome segregation ATPase